MFSVIICQQKGDALTTATDSNKTVTEKELDKLRAKDKGYQMAKQDVVSYMDERRKVITNIAWQFRLDPEELFQEAFEVVLTCLRDYQPVYEKNDGSQVSVKFNTFFGSRIEGRAMELRNTDPEYKARQAITDGMSAEEKTSFRENPPLLVQHIDQDTVMREHLLGEVSEAKEQQDVGFRIGRDTFFDRKLTELISKEKDEKKQAMLMHVKVGGIYNFQEIAYHFGVTDSRASQVMNELMDAFYVQRIIDGDREAVAYDFKKLKFNDKRIKRLVGESLVDVDEENQKAILAIFKKDFAAIDFEKPKAKTETIEKAKTPKKKVQEPIVPPAYEEVFTKEENEAFPLVSVGMQSIDRLKELVIDFRDGEDKESFEEFVESFDPDSALFPAVVDAQGYVIDGVRRIKAAKAKGKTEYLCIIRDFKDEYDKKLMRILLNYRLHNVDKIALYHYIKGLNALGLSQQKISDLIDVSRTNVLVYAKVRDKAAPKMRALFEDGLIQITNASSCTDLPNEIQDALADFIRRHGIAWSKGSRFNKVYLAASENRLEAFEAQEFPDQAYQEAPQTENEKDAKPSSAQANKRLALLEKQLRTHEIALKDAEVWAAQRESVINRQNTELQDVRTELDDTKRQLEAAELASIGTNEKVIETELKQLRAFYAITERLSGANQAVKQANKDVLKLDMRRSQINELQDLIESTEENLNKLRVEVVRRSGKRV